MLLTGQTTRSTTHSLPSIRDSEGSGRPASEGSCGDLGVFAYEGAAYRSRPKAAIARVTADARTPPKAVDACDIPYSQDLDIRA